jgi:nucleoside-diphosphate-sugar epimerase
MGAVKRVLITGASGFIGSATVDAALDAGLEVVAVQRRIGANRTGVTYVSVDLTVRDSVEVLVSAMTGCDVVIHLAAAMSGDAKDHARLTLTGTEHVIATMKNAGIGHLTLASSLAVYDTSKVAIGAALTDATPLVTTDSPRDAYSDAKAQQETLVSKAGFETVTVVRPGIVYDADRLWNAHWVLVQDRLCSALRLAIRCRCVMSKDAPQRLCKQLYFGFGTGSHWLILLCRRVDK